MVNELWQHSSIAQDLKEEGQAEGHLAEARDPARLALEGRFGTVSHFYDKPTSSLPLCC
jgi:hypothetical protein